MSRKCKIKIETREFASVGDARSFYSKKLNAYPIGERVSEEDQIDLVALLDRHEEKHEKVGSGIDHITVKTAPEGRRGRCFWIERTDGSSVDFSFKRCLDPRPCD